VSAAPIVTPQGSVAFRFEVSAALSDELVEPWQADGLHCVPLGTTGVAGRAEPDTAERSAASCRRGITVRVDLRVSTS
jgi:hypothetical protein